MFGLSAWRVGPTMALWQLSQVFRVPSEDSRCTPAIAFLSLSSASQELEQPSGALLSEAILCRDRIATIVSAVLSLDTSMLPGLPVWCRAELRVQVVAAVFPRK